MGSHNSNPLLSTFLNNSFGWVLYCLRLSAQWHIKSRLFFSIIIQTGYLYIHSRSHNTVSGTSIFVYLYSVEITMELCRCFLLCLDHGRGNQVDGGFKGPMMLVTNTKHSLQGDHVYNISLFRKGYEIIILNTSNRNIKTNPMSSAISRHWHVTQDNKQIFHKGSNRIRRIIHDA